jgi:enterochelin esterase-like enzyme
MTIRVPLFLIAAFAAIHLNAQQDNPRIDKRTGLSHDTFYTLGPDSQLMEAVPQGQFAEPKIIPSKVFPGYQHTYWVYVPAQYDPEKPTAVMIFNDGAAMKADDRDVRGHHVLDNLIYRREIPVMLGVFINPGRLPDHPVSTDPNDSLERTFHPVYEK